MANTFVTLKEIARRALPMLSDNLVMPALCCRDFSDDYHDRGDTVQIRRPTVFTAEDFNEANGVSYQDFKEDAVEVKLDHIATVDARASAVESATSMDDLERIFIRPAAAALAEKINRDGLMLYKQVWQYTGTAGTTPSSLSDLAAVRKKMNIMKVPAEGRAAVWDPEADAAFTQLAALVNAEKSGSTRALREGAVGRVYGMDNYMSQSVCVHEVGTAISGGLTLLADGAAAKGSAYLHVDGGSGAETLKAGDLITVGGETYSVEKDCTFASGEGDVHVCGGLRKNVADNAAITYAGSSSVTKYTCNLAFHPMAFAYVTRPLIDPDGQGVASYVTSYNGLTLRVTKGYDQAYKRSAYSMDVLYGFKCVYPELAVRVLG